MIQKLNLIYNYRNIHTFDFDSFFPTQYSLTNTSLFPVLLITSGQQITLDSEFWKSEENKKTLGGEDAVVRSHTRITYNSGTNCLRLLPLGHRNCSRNCNSHL